MLRIPSVLAVLLLAAPAWAADPAPGNALPLLKQIDQGFVQVFEKVAPSVVIVEALKKDDDDGDADFSRFDFLFRDREEADSPKDAPKEKPRLLRRPRSEGSGFIIRADGFI
ncbi:MAG TPA: hypothetical protein VFD27_18005, partial [Chthoniobacteraceae bacterium]|nr:hypothetical protein [Chthoniobacteraceae bacterium]